MKKDSIKGQAVRSWRDEPDDAVVCYCRGVDKAAIVSAIQKGADSIESIQQATGAGIGNRCKELNPRGRCCCPDIAEILRIYG